MNTQTPFMVLSVDLATLEPAHNAARRELFVRQLARRGLRYTDAEGSYNGSREVSYVIPVHNQDDENAILGLARAYGQESVLSVDTNHFASLLFLRAGHGGTDIERVEGVGFWRNIDTSANVLPSNYTRVMLGDKPAYFTTTPHP